MYGINTTYTCSCMCRHSRSLAYLCVCLHVCTRVTYIHVVHVCCQRSKFPQIHTCDMCTCIHVCDIHNVLYVCLSPPKSFLIYVCVYLCMVCVYVYHFGTRVGVNEDKFFQISFLLYMKSVKVIEYIYTLYKW